MKRETLSPTPDETHFIVFTQELRDSGWYNLRARTATAEEIKTMSQGKSGSHNAHARLAPSDSKRWSTCTASINFEAENAPRVPKDTGSVYAQEGTLAHDYAEAVLTGKIRMEQVPNGERSHDKDFPDADFYTPVKTYVDYCQSITPEGVVPFVEAETPLFYDTDSTGTCDFVVVASEDLVEVVDYKHGAGVYVEVEDNPQLAIYAMSTIADLESGGLYDFEPDTTVKITVAQPRYRGSEPIRTWELTLKDLRDFCRDLEYAAVQIQENRGLKFAPSEDACRWCACKAFCAARADALTEGLEPDGIDHLAALDDLDREEAKKMEPEDRIAARCGQTLTDEQLVSLFQKASQITSFLKDVTEHLTDRANAGQPVEGTKLVMGREGNRAWADEEEADKVIGRRLKADERYTKKLITPTQAQKLLKEAFESKRFERRFDELVTRSPAKPVLAPESDRRQAITAPVDALPELS